MGSCQVAAGLPQAGLVVGACQLQAPQGDRRGNAPAQALEAATLPIRQTRHRAVQPQMAPQRAQLVLRGSCVYQRMSPVLPVCVQALNRQPAGFTGEPPARPAKAPPSPSARLAPALLQPQMASQGAQLVLWGACMHQQVTPVAHPQ